MNPLRHKLQNTLSIVEDEVAAFEALSECGYQAEARGHLYVAQRLVKLIRSQQYLEELLGKAAFESLQRVPSSSPLLGGNSVEIASCVRKQVGMLKRGLVNSSRSSFQRKIPLILTLSFLVAFVGFYFRQINIAINPVAVPDASLSASYRQIPTTAEETVFWVEFPGDDNFLYRAGENRVNDSLRFRLTGLSEKKWSTTPQGLEHPGHLYAKQEGTINLHFPRELIDGRSTASLLVYLAAPSSRISSLLASDSGGREIIDQLRNGRWAQFPLSEQERRLGMKSINLKSLTGHGVFVVAVALTAK